MSKRRRFKQSISLKGRLANFAEEALRKASNLPPGSDRDEMLKKSPPSRHRVPHDRMGPLARTAAADPEQRRSMKALDGRTMANLDVALEEACRSLPHGGDHESCSIAQFKETRRYLD